MKHTPARFNYGWVVVGVAITTMTLVYGIRHTFSVFYPSILADFGWRRGETAAILSVNLLVYGFFAPLAGNIADRWKPRRVMFLGAVLLGLATAGCSLATRLWHFYVLFGLLVPVGSAFCGWPIFSPSLANWFTRKRGLALGLGQMGGGLSFVCGLLVEVLITRLGWRSTFVAMAVLLMLFVLPLAVFLFRYRPADRLSRQPAIPAYEAYEPAHGSGGWTVLRAMKTFRLWLFVLAQSLFWGLGGYLILAHQVKFATDVGYSSMLAASVFALFGIFMITGQVSSLISDWIGREITATLATVLVLVAVAALMGAAGGGVRLLYAYAILFGLGMGLFSPTVFAGTADAFHGRYFGGISGLLLAGMGVGGVVGPWLGGFLYDRTGSYSLPFIISAACFVVACAGFWIAAPRRGSRGPRTPSGRLRSSP